MRPRLALSPSTVSASQQQLDVGRRADNGGPRRAEGPQGSYACRVRRPQLGQIQPNRTGAPVDDPLEFADGLALQPTFESDHVDARIRAGRDVEAHEPGTSRRVQARHEGLTSVCFIGPRYRKIGAGRDGKVMSDHFRQSPPVFVSPRLTPSEGPRRPSFRDMSRQAHEISRTRHERARVAHTRFSRRGTPRRPYPALAITR